MSPPPPHSNRNLVPNTKHAIHSRSALWNEDLCAGHPACQPCWASPKDFHVHSPCLRCNLKC